LAILILLSFFLSVGHGMIPHHHHDEKGREISCHEKKHAHHGHDHEDETPANHHDHPFPYHQHVSANSDFNLVRLNNESFQVKRNVAVYYRPEITIIENSFPPGTEKRRCHLTTFGIKSPLLSGSVALRAPPFVA
jgi:hypothetical protein